MPASVLMVLILVVAPYVLLTGAASMGFIAALRRPSPTDPASWPTVFVVPLDTESTTDDIRQTLQDCDYPSDRVEIVDSAVVPEEFPSNVDDILEDLPPSVEASPMPGHQALETVEGGIILLLPPGGTVSSQWIRSMVRHCTAEAPIVVGPSIVEHGDLFLPRLQGLQHLSRLAFTGGLSFFGLPTRFGTSNWAVRSEVLRTNVQDDGPERQSQNGLLATDAPVVFNPDEEAVVASPPVSSFFEYLRRQARYFCQTRRASSWIVRGQAAGLWLVHAVLLACSIAAVALPAWRQPALLALLGKMGADVLLTLPAAKQYGQRGLFRSLVPTELMLVLALPLAGLWSLWSVPLPSSPQDPEPEFTNPPTH